MILNFWVAGVAQPQGSARGFKAGNRVIVTSANKNLRPWRHAVTSEAQEKMAFAGPDASIEGPVALTLTFYFPRISSHFNKRGVKPNAPYAHSVRPDLDKLARAVIDALADAGVLRNDSQVAALSAYKVYGPKPGCAIRVESGAAWRFAAMPTAPEAPYEERAYTINTTPAIDTAHFTHVEIRDPNHKG